MIPATQSRVRRLQRLQRLHTRENVTFAYEAAGEKVTWKPANDPTALDLLEKVVPVANVSAHEKQQRIAHALDELRNEKVGLQAVANARAAELESNYERLKKTLEDVKVKVSAYPPDLLGVYVLLPGGNA